MHLPDLTPRGSGLYIGQVGYSRQDGLSYDVTNTFVDCNLTEK